MLVRNAVLAAALLCLVACGQEVGGTTTGSFAATGGSGGGGGAAVSGPALLGGEDCDPMVPEFCGLPFPSNVYLSDDPATVTGKRVSFGAQSLPIMTGPELQVQPELLHTQDGFSAGQAPFTYLAGATVTGLPTQDTIAESLQLDSPTVLIEADTGVAVPHFAELDRTTDDPSDQAFMIRPVVRLRDATRYIVAIRNVVDVRGVPLSPNPVFAALRDGTTHDDPTVELRRDLYDDILAKLTSAGYDTGDLQIAWDYTTASRENNTRWLLHMRDEALATVGEEGPEYVIDTVEDNPNEHLIKRIRGRMTVPLYLTQVEAGGRLAFDDATGLPKQNGTGQFEFVVHVPHSATVTPAPLLQNGHGLLGSLNEGQNGYLAEFANAKNYVAFSVNMVGMHSDDETTIQKAILTDFAIMRDVYERQHQGILNSLLAMRMMKGRFWKDAEVQFDGKSAIDPTECYYRGDSQGGIFGGTYMALSTDVTRGLLGEPGMPYNILLNRSTDFSTFLLALKLNFPRFVDIQVMLGLAQMLWDRTEPSGYVPYITDNRLADTPEHHVLIHVAIGDYQVTPLGAHIMARALNAVNVAPVNREIWEIPSAMPPLSGNAMVEFDFGLPEAPKTNVPPEGPKDDDPHDKVRVLQAVFDQTDVFLRQGTVVAACDGPCDPE